VHGILINSLGSYQLNNNDTAPRKIVVVKLPALLILD